MTYTEEEIHFLKENYSELGAKKCAEYLGKSIGSIKHQARKNGFSKKLSKLDSLKSGDIFGKLTLVYSIQKKHYDFNGTYWVCKCECGKEKTVYQQDLRCEKVKSCGCLNSGLSKNNLYKLWNGIKQRCFNKNVKFYHRYGGRGITMFEEWINNPAKFISDIKESIGERPEGMTLDRIDNNGNYEPGNLRWADETTQKLNSTGTNLSKKDILDIREKYKQGITQLDIAKEYNMSSTQIWRIINEISWKGV